MLSKVLVAASIVAVVSAQSVTPAPAPTGGASAGGSTGGNQNAFNIPEGGMPAAAVGKDYPVEWALNGAPADKPVVLLAVAGPSTNLQTFATLASAAKNDGTATFKWPANVPPTAAIEIVQPGTDVNPNFTGQFAVQGGNADAKPIGGASDTQPSATGSAEPSASASGTESGNPSTMETVTGSASSEASATGESSASNSAALPTETQSSGTTGTQSASSSTPTSGAASFKYSSVALFGGLVAALFAL